MNCKFCYARWELPNDSLSTSELKDLILNAKSFWFNHFGFTWWNTFERSDIWEILYFLKDNDIKVRVDIHWLGDKIELIEKYSEYIDIIWLPLDWHISSIHDFTRNTKGHFNIVVSLIKKIKEKVKNVELKIHTVLTLKNYASVIMMKDLIKELNPDYWSIYKYFPAWTWYTNRKEFELSDKLFNFACDSLPKNINDIIVDVPWDEIHDKSFLMSSSNGQIYGCFDSKTESYMDYWMYNEWWFKNALDYYWEDSINDLTNREFYWKYN